MKNFTFKNKITNHLMKNGEKKTSENLIVKSFKELQKNSLKNSKKLVKIAVINSIPIFKIHTIENKKQKKKKRKIKEIPFFITSENFRISLAIKLILNNIRKKHLKMYIKLNTEILALSQEKGNTILVKNKIQKQALLNKRYFNFYRWQ